MLQKLKPANIIIRFYCHMKFYLPSLKMFLFLIFQCIFLLVNSQNFTNPKVHFSYDANGNREHRWVTFHLIEKGAITDTIVKNDSTSRNSGEAKLKYFLISLSPNPTKGIIDLTINGYTESSFEYEVYSIEGKLLLKNITNGPITKIDISFLLPGVYILTLKDKSDFRKWKIIKH